MLLTEKQNVKIGDFGLSKLKCIHKQSSGRVGTTHWMAPEILRSEVYTDAADVYSYGAILWEMLSGQIPYQELS
jgi:serine/threonine protein kinase